MRVAMIGDEFIPDIGGGSLYTLGLGKALAEVGVDPVLITHHHNGQPGEEVVEGIKVKRLEGFVIPRSNRAISMGLASDLYQTVKHGGFDVVHAQDMYSSMSLMSLWAANRRNIPALLTCHSYFNPNLKLRIIHQPLLKVISYSDGVIAVSKDSKEYCKRLGIPSSKIYLIHNGVDLSTFSPDLDGEDMRNKFNICPDDPLIFTAIRLIRKKGPYRLLSAFKKTFEFFPNAKLVIAGEGPEMEGIQKRAREFDLDDSVHLIGPIPQEKVAKFMATSNVFVLPSLIESFGMVALEALATGVPFIGPNIGVIPEIVEDGTNGFLITPGDVDEMANAINRILSEEKLGKRIEENAPKIVREKLSWKACAKKTIELYGKVSQNK